VQDSGSRDTPRSPPSPGDPKSLDKDRRSSGAASVQQRLSATARTFTAYAVLSRSLLRIDSYSLASSSHDLVTGPLLPDALGNVRG